MSTSTAGPKNTGRSSNTKKTTSSKSGREGNVMIALASESGEDKEMTVKVAKVMELTKASKDDAVVALHDTDYDVSRAVNKILEGDADESGWKTVQGRSKEKATASKVSDSKAVNGTARNGPGQKWKRGDVNKNRGEGFNRDAKNQEGRTRGPNIKRNEDEAAGKETEGKRERREPRPEGFSRNNINRRNGEPRKPGDRPFRGENNRGIGRGRGTRTFSNQQRSTGTTTGNVPDTVIPSTSSVPVVAASSDDFPNSIDTWSNTTADPDAKPTPVPITSMTVGNWSDVVSGAANEDWSEEDYETNLRETKVFVPSGRTLTEQDESLVNKVSLDDSLRPNQDLNRKEQAGAQILQSLQPQQTSQASRTNITHQQQQQQPYIERPQIGQTFTNRQAAESIKSLVGISTGHGQYPSGQQTRGDKTSVRVPQTRRTTRIPDTAVEMPSSDSVTSLGVQFGALDVRDFGENLSFKSTPDNFESSQMKTGVQSQIQQQSSHLQKQPLLSSSVYDQQQKPHGEQGLRSSSDIMKGLKPSDSSIDARSGVKHNVSPKVTDLYSGQQTEQFKQQATSYGASNAYGSGNQFNTSSSSYGQSSSYPSSYQSSSGNQSVQKTSMKDLDPPQNRQTSYDLPSSGLSVNSTQTTNVLKNSLSATGKQQQQQGNVSQRNQLMNQLPQHFMPPGPGYFYPVYDPMQMTGGQQDSNQFTGGYNHMTDNKFGREAVSDVTAGAASSSPATPVVSQSHAQQTAYLAQQPPGYHHPQGGFYYLPGPHLGMPPQGFYIPPASTAHVPPPTGFGKNNAYASGYPGNNLYEGTGINLQSDYGVKPSYGQSTQQQTQSKPLASGVASDLMSGSSGQTSGQSSYGKPSNQKQMNQYSTGNQAYNLGGSQGYNSSSYIVQPMNQGFQDTNQGQNRTGMSGGPKPPSNVSKGGYGQNVYSSQW